MIISHGGSFDSILESAIELQKSTTRNVCRTGLREHSEPLFRETNALSFHRLHCLRLLTMFHMRTHELTRPVHHYHRHSKDGDQIAVRTARTEISRRIAVH